MTRRKIPGTGAVTHPKDRHRILSVDALRGFALGGILLSNVLVMAAPALSAAYASGLLLWFGRKRGAATAARLAPAGRVALTHYLLQSLAMALVFTGYGLRLYGRPGAAAVLGVALAFYALQIAVSAPFLRRFRLGPAEWLLRTLTVAGRPAAAAVADGTSVVQDTRHATRP